MKSLERRARSMSTTAALHPPRWARTDALVGIQPLEHSLRGVADQGAAREPADRLQEPGDDRDAGEPAAGEQDPAAVLDAGVSRISGVASASEDAVDDQSEAEAAREQQRAEHQVPGPPHSTVGLERLGDDPVGIRRLYL